MYKITILLISFAILISSCQKEKKLNSSREINSNWEFKNQKDTSWLSAVVPGSIHEDLFVHKLIIDPFIEENEQKVQWVEKESWEYRTQISLSPEELTHEFIDLNFDGIDSYASIYINDSLLGNTDNMFLAYGFTLATKNLKQINELRLVLHSPTVEGEKIKQLTRSNLTRKAQYPYGWDLGPILVTSGIWKPVRIKAWSGAKIESVFHRLDSLSTEKAIYNTSIEVFSDKNQEVEIQLTLSEKFDNNLHKVTKKESFNLKKGLNTISLPFKETNPVFWYPHNYGEPFLYNVYVDLYVENALIQTQTQKLGMRDLKLIQKPDSIGKSFYVEINGIPIFCKGANYMPPHFFNGRLDSASYAKVIEDAREANMNMLRVASGGVYEKDEFYEICDKRGVLVWQDFMFTRIMYTSDTAFLKSVETEARQNVKRLRNHASVALWVGKDDILTEEQGTKISEDYQKIFNSILDKVIKEEDPEKLYLQSSSSVTFNTKVNNVSSEFGFQSFPELSTLYKIIRDTTDLGINTLFMKNRQRDNMEWMKPGENGNLLIKQYMDVYYGEVKSFEEFIYVSQLMQADALKAGMEAYRMDKPHTMVALFGQIDDCWPGVSWSTIDYYGNWKAAQYAAKRANSNLLIGAERKDSLLIIKGTYDGLEFPKVQASVEWMNADGKTIWKETLKEFRMSNAKNEVFFMIPESRLNLVDGIVLMTLKSQKDSITNVFYVEDYKSFTPKSTNIDIQVKKINGGYKLYLSSENLQRGVYVKADCKGRFKDNFFDILPNRKHEIVFMTDQEIEPKFTSTAFAWNK